MTIPILYRNNSNILGRESTLTKDVFKGNGNLLMNFVLEIRQIFSHIEITEIAIYIFNYF